MQTKKGLLKWKLRAAERTFHLWSIAVLYALVAIIGFGFLISFHFPEEHGRGRRGFRHSVAVRVGVVPTQQLANLSLTAPPTISPSPLPTLSPTLSLDVLPDLVDPFITPFPVFEPIFMRESRPKCLRQG